jgi:hypothetical protein
MPLTQVLKSYLYENMIYTEFPANPKIGAIGVQTKGLQVAFFLHSINRGKIWQDQ